MAIDREVVVTMRPDIDGPVRIRSADRDGEVVVAADGRDDPGAVEPEWGRLGAAVVRVLAESGRPAIGATLDVRSTLPIGGGLSSSAAFEVAVALALCGAARWRLAPHEFALAAQRAEHLGTGVPCGIQDQTASVTGGVFLLDCRTMAVEPLTLPPDVAVVVVDSGVARDLRSSPWAQRRAESFAVATGLGLRVLRDATPEQVAHEPRGRHAVHEIARVRDFAAALHAGDTAALGPLMLASHASSRDDMECSTPELDTLVEMLMDAGALGARLTGGGFGGCCVALAPTFRATDIGERVQTEYLARTGIATTPIVVHPAPGAGELPR